MTLRTRLTVAFVMVVLLPVLLGAVLVTRLLPQAVEGRQLDGLADTAQTASNLMLGFCQRARVTAEAAGRLASGRTPTETRLALEGLVGDRRVDGLRVSDARGRSLVRIGAQPTKAVDCAQGTPASEPFIASVVELRTPEGAAGTAVAVFSVDQSLVTLLRDMTGKDVLALLVGDRVLAGTAGIPEPVLAAGLRFGSDGAVVDGIAVVHRPATVGQPFGLLLTEPVEEGPGVLPVAVLVVVAALGLAVGIGLLLARATTRPLEELGEAAARIAGGDLDTTIEVRSRDEIGTLASAFNGMTEELRRHVGALEASRDELQAGLARLGDTLSSTHDLDRILTVVLETAMAATRAQAGMVMLLTPDRTELTLAAGKGLEDRGVAGDLRLPATVGVSGLVVQNGDPVHGRVGSGPGELVLGPGEPFATSLICVPLKSSGRVIGVLHLYDRAGAGEFEDSDLTTIRTFASQATVAIDNVLLHEEAQRLSITDGLTGLWNYRYFTMTVSKEIERAARFTRPLALLMLDLDHFKSVNDTHGHQRGDAVLVELAARVRGQVRDVDTVARYGGEEIVVVLPETDPAGATQAAERICDAVRRRPFGEPGQQAIEVTVSIGVAVFPTHGASSGALLRAADEALYAAKRGGRDQWRMAGLLIAAVPDAPRD